MADDGPVRPGDTTIRPRDMLIALAIAAFSIGATSIGVAAVTDSPMVTTTVPAPVVHVERVECRACASLRVLLHRIEARHDLTPADRRVVDRVTDAVEGVDHASTVTTPLPPVPEPTTSTTTSTVPQDDHRPITVTWPTTTTTVP